MLNRISLVTFLAVMTTLVLAAACGGSADENEPVVGGELHVYNWEDYFGETTLEDFSAEYGIEVFLDTYADENEMWSVIAADTSRYDIFIAADSVVGEMALEKLLAELDHSNIPNLSNIYPEYLDLPSDPGNIHGVPYDWGTTGVLYDSQCFEPEELSWSAFWDPRVSGKVAMDSDFTVVLGTTLISLGYPMNSSDPDHLDAAVLALQELRAKNAVQFLDWTEITAGVSSGELCAGQVFNGDAADVVSENEDLVFFVPDEGSDVYVDTMAIPRDARNKAAAELLINYILRPDVHAAVNNNTGYASPNRASVEQGYIDAEFLADPISYPDTDNLQPWVVFDDELFAVWNEAWSEVENWGPVAAAQ